MIDLWPIIDMISWYKLFKSQQHGDNPIKTRNTLTIGVNLKSFTKQVRGEITDNTLDQGEKKIAGTPKRVGER